MALQTETVSAIVTDNQDPKKRGCIKIKSRELTGNDNEIDEWIPPVHAWGWFTIPDVDEEVEIEFVAEDEYAEGAPMQAFFDAPRFRWKGRRFESKEDKGARPADDRFLTHYGKRRGFATPGGHILLFDDTKGDEQVTLSWKAVDESKFAYIDFNKDGSCTISAANGSMIFMDAKNGSTSVVDNQDGGSNLINMSETGVKVIDKFSNIIEMKDGVVQVLSQKDVIVQAGANATVKAGADLKAECQNATINAMVAATIDTITAQIKSVTCDIGKVPTDPLIKGTIYTAAENIYLAGLTAFVAGLNAALTAAITPVPPPMEPKFGVFCSTVLPLTVTLQTIIAAFQAALPTSLSLVNKTQ